MAFGFIATERKWQQRWKHAKLYETNPAKRKKWFMSMVIPYVNGNWHVGHSYTFTRTDVYARFKRLQGYNLLLAQGFHATGEPIVGAVERIKQGDASQISTFKAFGATDRDLKDFVQKGPRYVAQFWAHKIRGSAEALGFGIDWRRTFTLSLDPCFSRFVEWQYETLRKKGYVVQGTHPVVWCPNDQSPTGDHDRLQGEGESPIAYVMLKFVANGYVLPAATLRPETVYGVTNLWLNPNADYIEAAVGDERWILSARAAEKLRDQTALTIIAPFDPRTLIGKTCTDPVGNRTLPILPAAFVDPNTATGVVMSVPSHAPYDWIALREMVERDELQTYGFTKNDVEPIPVVATDGLAEQPALAVVERMHITSSKDREKLDEATASLYKKEFHGGVLTDACGPYAGMRVSDVKERLIADFIEKNAAALFWETTGPVVCRCTTPCHVKILENQWFLKFSDTAWKEKVRAHLKTMAVYPTEAQNNFENTIDWLQDKACTRKSGLGTPLPWDREWIVETLSDSTIYMAYYTIAKTVARHKLKPAQLTNDVFEYVFFGKGDGRTVTKKSGTPKKALDEMRSEFEYFYPIDIRVSGKDLVQNHLTFYLFHHVAIFQKPRWPKAIAVNGFVNVEGDKMSKSKGNIIPLMDLIRQYGADLTRINIACSSEGLEDADWRAENIKAYRSRLEFVFDTARQLGTAKRRQTATIDRFLLSRVDAAIGSSSLHFDRLEFRSAVQHTLFQTVNDVRWYMRRTGSMKNAHRATLAKALRVIALLNAPFVPHFAEELWAKLGEKKSVWHAAWPKPDTNAGAPDAEQGEAFIRAVLADIERVQKLAKIEKQKNLTLFVAPAWKFEIYQKIKSAKTQDPKELMQDIVRSGRYGKATLQYIQATAAQKDLAAVIPKKAQIALLGDATAFIERETGLRVVIADAEKSENQKAQQATPQRCGILIE